MGQPVPRTQADGHAADEFYGQLAAIDFPEPSLTRQEMAKDTDINYIISKHGINPFAAPLPFGEANFTIDLQQAIAAVETARRWHAKLPPDLKATFPTWESILEAANNGTLQEQLKDLEKVPGAPPEPNTPPPAA